MKMFDCPDHVKPLRFLWFIALSCVWITWTIIRSNAIYKEQQARIATLSGVSLWWHKDDPAHEKNETVMVGFLLLPLVFAAATQAAKMHAAYRQNEAQKFLDLQNLRERHDFENKIQDMEREGEKQASLSNAAQSKQEVIMRLGSIDQFIRVVAIEHDVSERTLALQAAHSEMTTLAAKVASDQISRDAIDAPEIRELASETSNDLARLGLSEDRLNRDIVRMFKLSGNGVA